MSEFDDVQKSLKQFLDGASDEDKKKLEQTVSSTLPTPKDESRLFGIWLLVLLLLGLFGLVFAFMAYSRSVDDKSLEPFSTLLGIIVGAIVGLIAPGASQAAKS